MHDPVRFLYVTCLQNLQERLLASPLLCIRLSICPSVRMEQFACQWIDLHEI